MSYSNFQRTATWLRNCGKESNKLNAESISVKDRMPHRGSMRASGQPEREQRGIRAAFAALD